MRIESNNQIQSVYSSNPLCGIKAQELIRAFGKNLLCCQVGHIVVVLGDSGAAHANDMFAGQITMSGIDIIVSQIGCLDVHAHLLLIDNAGHIIRIHNCNRKRRKQHQHQHQHRLIQLR